MDKRRDHERFARPPSAVPVPVDEEVTPLPTTADEAMGWQHIDRRMVAVEAAVGGYTRQVDLHEQSIGQWSKAAQECLVDIAGATARLTAIETSLGRDWQRFGTSLDDVTEALNAIGERMGRLEVSVSNVVAMQASQAALVAAIDRRVGELERDKAVAAGASSERVRLIRLGHGIAVALAGVAGFLANHFFG